MFYTLQEVIQKLGKTEAEIRTFVKEGKLREFRDGAKQLYKIEDVDAIAGSGKGQTAKLDDSLQISIDETGEVSLAPEELDVLMGSEDKAQQSKFKLDETGELMAEETLGGTPKDKSGKSKTDDEILLSPAADSTKGASDGISLSADSSKPASEVSNDDTKISQGGDTINVLGESDTGYKISEDTSGETKLIQKKAKALDDKGGDEIARLDDDINLDAGGSGSGLLDLSLQADDTSLGAVLDDIYPESPGAPAEQTPAADVEAAAEAEQMLEPQQAGEPAVTAEEAILQDATMPYAAVTMAVEPPADTASNVFGAILFVPLIVLIYAAIVVISGYKPISDMGILSAISPIIWYVAIGASAIVILASLIASFSGGPKKPKAPKAPKEPKVKKVKPPKEKKAKKGEQPPAAKA